MVTPVINLTYLNGQLTAIDGTTYGGANPDRSAHTVNFGIVYKASDGDVTVNVGTYDEATVTQVSASVGDGYYQGTITISDGATTVTATSNILVSDNLTTCLNSKRTEWLNSACCGDNEDTLYQEFLKLNTISNAIGDSKTSGVGFDKAQCLLEMASVICTDQICMCGC